MLWNLQNSSVKGEFEVQDKSYSVVLVHRYKCYAFRVFGNGVDMEWRQVPIWTSLDEAMEELSFLEDSKDHEALLRAIESVGD